MPLDTLNVDPEAFFRVERSVPCGMFVEGTTSALSAHLRGHGVIGPDSTKISCPWAGCSKTLKRGGLTRHILTHLGVKVQCSICGVVRCRRDLLRAHFRSSESCRFAFVEIVHGPEGHLLVPTGWTATHQV
ncbi:hypothetical protein F4604DRAFT_1718695 [Suillus subluteus]|nr:hypothetical protein F4604DRAFT_1718695 [Suillus subluteus]